MGFFDDLWDGVQRAFTPPGGGGGPSIPAALPALPALPSILSAPPSVTPMAALPSMASPTIRAAGNRAVSDVMSRAGRASTILTTKKKKRSGGQAETFDNYSSTTL